MKNYDSPYLEYGESGERKNAWTAYFAQLSDYSLEDVYMSQRVCLSGRRIKQINDKIDSITTTILTDRGQREKWSNLYRTYFYFNTRLKEKVKKVYCELMAVF